MCVDLAQVPHVLTQIERLSEAVKTEFDLVGTRMTWLVTSQSFLFVAFATSVSNLKSTEPILRVTLGTLVVLVPIMGAAFAVLVGIALRAAHKVCIRLKDDRDKLMSSLPIELRVRLVSSKDDEHSFGNLPANVIPWILVFVWGVLLASLCWAPWP